MNRIQRVGVGTIAGGLMGLAPATVVYGIEQTKNITAAEVAQCQAALGPVATRSAILPKGCEALKPVFYGTSNVSGYDLPAATDLPKKVNDYETSEHRIDAGIEIGIIVVSAAVGTAVALAQERVDEAYITIPDHPPLAEAA